MADLLVTEPLVQQWLEETKLTVDRTPDELDQTARDIVFSQVSQVYDTSTWVSTATTPSLILRICSMFIAAWIYERQYSENLPLDDTNWGVKLESMANLLIAGIVGLTIDIPGVLPGAIGTLSDPIFYPTDAQETDGSGEERKFTMGKVF